MRVDLNISSMPELDASRGSAAAKAPVTTNGAGSEAVSSDVVAKLSTGSEAVENLRAELNRVPEIRQQLVDSLRLAINSGTYKISPRSIAERMLADSDGRSR